VGIDAIMNMKGYGGDWGLERYPLFKAINLRSQLTNEQLIDKAVELSADAILISQVVTQRDSHIKNLKEFRDLINNDKRLPKGAILVVGGPRIDHALALKLGFDAGFGTGTKPSQVANFIVHEYMKRHHKKEKAEHVEKLKGEDALPGVAEHIPTPEPSVSENLVPVPASKPQVQPEKAPHEKAASPEVSGETAPAGAKHKRRRRGRRGGRRHHKKHEAGNMKQDA
jgi:methylmalonyl-CoA mutase cobalamin-binding subunit